MTTFINCERDEFLAVAELAESEELASVEYLGNFPADAKSITQQVTVFKCLNGYDETVYIWEGANGGDPAIVAEDDVEGFLKEYSIA